MKPLKIVAVTNSKTDSDKLNKAIGSFKNLTISIETDIEKVVDFMHLKDYDLLILDKSLPAHHFNKINRLAQLIHPDAVRVQLNFDDEEFIRYKMAELMQQWAEAQSESSTNYIDGMNALH